MSEKDKDTPRKSIHATIENVHELEGYDDLVERILSTFTPEERLAGLQPEERLAGLRVEEILRYLRERAEVEGTLPAAMLEALRKALDETP